VSPNIRTIARGAAEYPAALEELPDPPPMLWAAGVVLDRPAVALVGTRRADAAGIAFTERLARELALTGATVISGGAAGIDAAAHRGGMDRTLVVQAAPLERTYPRSNRRLFQQVLARGGGWISETPPGCVPHGFRFLARNRIVAALADAVVVVQAPLRSGALSTAAWARTLGRPLFAVPAAPWDPRGEGTLALLRRGARICTSAADVAEALEWQLVLPARDAPPPRRGADARRVLEALGAAPQHVDAIAREARLPAQRVSIALVELALSGRARQENGFWRATR
jgi:DNA processing protein